jgi:hypothetical protein
MYMYINWYVLYICIIPPDDELQICPKHVEVDGRNKLRINSVSSWFSLHGYNKEVLHSKNIYTHVHLHFVHPFHGARSGAVG